MVRTSQAASGDGEARGRVLAVANLPNYRPELFRVALSLCGSRHDADDLVQETYLNALRRPRWLHADSELNYLLRVLRRTWITAHRRGTRRVTTAPLPDDAELLGSAVAMEDTVVDTLALRAAIAELPAGLRETLVAVDVIGLSYREAAHFLGTPVGTVMSRLSRARGRAAARLQG